MRNVEISSIRDLVKAFGGTGAMAEFLGVVPSAVSNMIAEDRLPRGYHLQVYLEADRRKMRLNKKAIFGLDEFPSRQSAVA